MVAVPALAPGGDRWRRDSAAAGMTDEAATAAVTATAIATVTVTHTATALSLPLSLTLPQHCQCHWHWHSHARSPVLALSLSWHCHRHSHHCRHCGCHRRCHGRVTAAVTGPRCLSPGCHRCRCHCHRRGPGAAPGSCHPPGPCGCGSPHLGGRAGTGPQRGQVGDPCPHDPCPRLSPAWFPPVRPGRGGAHPGGGVSTGMGACPAIKEAGPRCVWADPGPAGAGRGWARGRGLAGAGPTRRFPRQKCGGRQLRANFPRALPAPAPPDPGPPATPDPPPRHAPPRLTPPPCTPRTASPRYGRERGVW